MDSCITLDPDFLKVAEELGEKYSIAMLSNDVKEWSCFLRDKFYLNKLCKCVIISGDIGCRKPDKRIYKELLKKLGCKPVECLFIDDRINNLKQASDFGIKTIWFCRDKETDIKHVGSTIYSLKDLLGAITIDEVFTGEWK